MSERADFTVPKDRLEVTVHLDKETALQGAIFLEYYPAELPLFRKVLTFLEDSAGFFPLALAGGGTEFINKRTVRMVEVGCSEQDNDVCRLLHMVPVIVVFADKESLSGDMLVDAPQEKSRLSDGLNLSGRFLSVLRDGRIYHINKDVVQKALYAK